MGTKFMLRCFLLESWAAVAGAGSKKERGNIWLWLEMVAGAGGWSSIDEGKGKYLAVVGARGWSSIDEGNERENIWLWLELDQRRKGKGKYLGGAPSTENKGNIWQAKMGSFLALMKRCV
ncbi:hypothetical protein WN943_025943 [Citrus x changshan-huyou]